MAAVKDLAATKVASRVAAREAAALTGACLVVEVAVSVQLMAAPVALMAAGWRVEPTAADLTVASYCRSNRHTHSQQVLNLCS